MKPNKYAMYVCPKGKTDGKSMKKINDDTILCVSGRFCKNNCSDYRSCKRWSK